MFGTKLDNLSLNKKWHTSSRVLSHSRHGVFVTERESFLLRKENRHCYQALNN